MTPCQQTSLPIGRWTGVVIALLLAGSNAAFAQETRYISDQLLVPVRSGAGGEYRILHKGLPSGTALTQFQVSEDGVWAEIETRGGTRGWLRAQYLQSEPPAALLLAEAREKLKQAEAERDRLRSSLSETKSVATEAGESLRTCATNSRRQKRNSLTLDVFLRRPSSWMPRTEHWLPSSNPNAPKLSSCCWKTFDCRSGSTTTRLLTAPLRCCSASSLRSSLLA